MSEPKFTKGPWHITEEDWVTGGYDIAVIQDKDGEEVLGISEWIRVNEPDLQLIAAAPDMYEALEEVVALVCDSCLEYERFKDLSYGRQKVVIAENPCNNCTNKVVKALRKARGETE